MVSGVVRAADVEMTVYRAGMSSRPLIKTDGLKVQEVFFDTGETSSTHAHAEEQAAYVVSGRFAITLQGDTYEAGAGDAYSIPGGVEHGVRAIQGGSYVLVSALASTTTSSEVVSDGSAHSHDGHGHDDHDHGSSG
jgi:quercetin dioxygenase-like cupin family protein